MRAFWMLLALINLVVFVITPNILEAMFSLLVMVFCLWRGVICE